MLFQHAKIITGATFIAAGSTLLLQSARGMTGAVIGPQGGDILAIAAIGTATLILGAFILRSGTTTKHLSKIVRENADTSNHQRHPSAEIAYQQTFTQEEYAKILQRAERLQHDDRSSPGLESALTDGKKKFDDAPITETVLYQTAKELGIDSTYLQRALNERPSRKRLVQLLSATGSSPEQLEDIYANDMIANIRKHFPEMTFIFAEKENSYGAGYGPVEKCIYRVDNVLTRPWYRFGKTIEEKRYTPVADMNKYHRYFTIRDPEFAILWDKIPDAHWSMGVQPAIKYDFPLPKK